MCYDGKYTGTLRCQKCKRTTDAFECKTRFDYDDKELFFLCPHCETWRLEEEVKDCKQYDSAVYNEDEE